MCSRGPPPKIFKEVLASRFRVCRPIRFSRTQNRTARVRIRCFQLKNNQNVSKKSRRAPQSVCFLRSGGDWCHAIPMNITIKDLLDAGVHFGHQVRRFNPKSKKFVFDNRNGISVIDLEKTYARLEAATRFIEETVASGKDVLFVGTKKQAKEVIREAAASCNMPFAAERWLGGTLTNWVTVKRSKDKFKRYLRMEAEGEFEKMHNKEVAAIRREMSRMRRNFEGIVDVEEMPGAIFVIDTRNEEIAVEEGRRLRIPIVALVDTNSDPSLVDYPIPGNDDSIKSIRIIVEAVLDAVQAGLARRSTPDSAPVRTLTPVVSAPVTEEQVPVTYPSRKDEDNTVPETFSSDD